jgi:hypothetical protein
LYRTQSCPVAIEVRVYLAMLVSMSIMVIVLMVMVVRCLIVLGRIMLMLMVVRFVIVSSLMIMHGFAPYDKPYDFCYRCNKSLSRTSNN